MRNLNTVGQKGAAESKRDVKMGSPRPSYGRARNDGTQGRNEYGRLGGLGIGPNYVNSYRVGTRVRVSVSTPLQVVAHCVGLPAYSGHTVYYCYIGRYKSGVRP